MGQRHISPAAGSRGDPLDFLTPLFLRYDNERDESKVVDARLQSIQARSKRDSLTAWHMPSANECRGRCGADQVRQVAVDCRNPMKAAFPHLRRPEGTSV
jgi:hypothetical protein